MKAARSKGGEPEDCGTDGGAGSATYGSSVSPSMTTFSWKSVNSFQSLLRQWGIHLQNLEGTLVTGEGLHRNGVDYDRELPTIMRSKSWQMVGNMLMVGATASVGESPSKKSISVVRGESGV